MEHTIKQAKRSFFRNKIIINKNNPRKLWSVLKDLAPSVLTKSTKNIPTGKINVFTTGVIDFDPILLFAKIIGGIVLVLIAIAGIGD